MAAETAYIGGFCQKAVRQFALDAEAVALDVGDLEIRIDRDDRGEWRQGCRRASRWIGEVAVLELHRLDEGWIVQHREEDVAVGTIVEDAVAAPDGGFVVVKRRPGESEARREQVLRIVETPWSAGRHR